MKYSWLSGTKFYQQGGELEQVMQAIAPILQGAAKEVQKGKVGENIQKLLSIASDANGSSTLEQLAEANPEIRTIIEQALQLAQQQEEEVAMQEKGGCLTCPKHKVLMRQGGRLVEMLVDCHNRPVYAKKGCKVKKGEIGIAGGLNKKYTGGPKVGVIGANEQLPTSPNIYYDDATSQWMQQNYVDGEGWKDASPLSMVDGTADLKEMTDGQVYTYWDPAKGQLMTRTYNAAQKGWTAPTAVSDLYQQGFKYTGDGKGVFDTDANAIAALGQDTFNSYYAPNSELKRWGSLTGVRGNSALGTTSQDVSARQAVDTLGFRGALREARDINAAKRRTEWNNRSAAMRNTYGINFDAKSVGKGTTTVNGKQYFKDENGNWYDENNNALAAGTKVQEDMYGSKREVRQAIRDQYKTNRDARRAAYTADSAAIIGTYLNNNRQKVTGTAGTAGKIVGGGQKTSNDYGTTTNTVLKKNGGWLNKYQEGGGVDEPNQRAQNTDPRVKRIYSSGYSPILKEFGDAIAAFTIPEYYSSDPNKWNTLQSDYAGFPTVYFDGNGNTSYAVTPAGYKDSVYDGHSWINVNSNQKVSMDPTEKYIIVPKTFDNTKHDAWWNGTTDEAATDNKTEETPTAETKTETKTTPKQPSWKEQYNAGKTTYNGYTKEQALAKQKEMQDAMKNGFQLSNKNWKINDGYFGKDSMAAWKEYVNWKNTHTKNKATTQNGRYTEDGGWEVQNSDGTWVAPQDSDNSMLAQMYAQNVNDVASEPTKKEQFVMNTASQVSKQPKSDTEWHPEGSTKTDADGRYYVWNGGKWEEVKDDYEPISYLSPAIDGRDNGKEQTIIRKTEGDQTPLDYNYLKNTMTDIIIQNNLQLEEKQKKLAKLLSNIKIK